MNLDRAEVGIIGGQPVHLISMENDRGMRAAILTYGATVMSLFVPDSAGHSVNVVLGYESPEDYFRDTFYAGALVGRFAGRIGGSRFQVDGAEYHLTPNAGRNHLHGGGCGFNKKNFRITESVCRNDSVSVTLHYRSKHMEEGYPGNVDVWISYTLHVNNTFIIGYRAVTDRSTHVNLTNHSYFNLSGTHEDILHHIATIAADRYVETDRHYIPTGRILSVAGTPYDFRSGKEIALDKGRLAAHGYNEYYILNRKDDNIPVAVLCDPRSGREMRIRTSLPGLLFYTGDYLSGPFRPCQGVCFETQFPPDSPNHSHFPSTLLRPGETFAHFTAFEFV